MKRTGEVDELDAAFALSFPRGESPTPQTKLHVANGDIYVSLQGHGLILKSYTGNSCTLIMADDSHRLYVTSTNCPGGVSGN